MLIELVCSPIFLFISFLIGKLPENLSDFNYDATSFTSLIARAFTIFPPDLFFLSISSIVFWLNVHMIWAFTEFLIKKIPFIGIK